MHDKQLQLLESPAVEKALLLILFRGFMTLEVAL